MSPAKIIIVFSHLPILITVGYALMVYKKAGAELKTFSWFLFVSGIIQIASLVFWFLGKNNFGLLHLYVALGFICLAWFYNTVLGDFINKKIIWVGATVFLLFTCINSLFIQKTSSFNSNALTVECVLVIILSLSTYMFLLNDIVKEKRRDLIKSLNWINSGLFIYYLSSLLIFYFGDAVTRFFPAHINRYIWVLHSFFSIVMYCCFFVGLWKRPKA